MSYTSEGARETTETGAVGQRLWTTQKTWYDFAGWLIVKPRSVGVNDGSSRPFTAGSGGVALVHTWCVRDIFALPPGHSTFYSVLWPLYIVNSWTLSLFPG